MYMTRELAKKIKATIEKELGEGVAVFRYEDRDRYNSQYDILKIQSSTRRSPGPEPVYGVTVGLDIAKGFFKFPVKEYDPLALVDMYEQLGEIIEQYAFIMSVVDRFGFAG